MPTDLVPGLTKLFFLTLNFVLVLKDQLGALEVHVSMLDVFQKS